MIKNVSPLKLFILSFFVGVLSGCVAPQQLSPVCVQSDSSGSNQANVSAHSAEAVLPGAEVSVAARRLGKEGSVSVLQLDRNSRLRTWASYDIWRHSLMISNRTSWNDAAWYVPLRTDTFTMPGREGRTASTKLVAAPIGRKCEELDDMLTSDFRIAFDADTRDNGREIVVNGMHVVSPKYWPSSTTLPVKFSVVAPPYGQSISTSTVWLTRELQSQERLKTIAFDRPLVLQLDQSQRSTSLLVILSSDVQLAYSDTLSMEYWLGCVGVQVELLHD